MAFSAEKKREIKAFVERWEALPCVEEEHSRSFWIEFVQQVLGIPDATHFLEFERKVKGRKIDVFYEDMGILIEQKGRGISLDEATVRSKKAGPETPFQQAKWYADNLPYSLRPRWIITCNFDEFRIYDMNRENFESYVSVLLEELPDQAHLFGFFSDKANSRLVKEQELSVKAGKIVSDLYHAFEGQYKNLESDKREQRSLNVLIVRLVFLLYAEDAGLLQERQAFGDYLQKFRAPQMRQALIDLFQVLDTPDGRNGTDDRRDPYAGEVLNAFPYINGGLFADEGIVIPQFTEQMRHDLILNASIAFDWKDISPTIFGAVFESTLNPETRRSGGMHYTSIENIHKVIDPLFLDDLKAELAEIEGEKVEKSRKMKLRAFQRKLASINVLDPACGSGNFLTESYLSLRKLENRVLEDLQGNQVALGFDDATSPIQVGIHQLYGIEINDFAVSVAKTALWIAEEQMMDATQEILQQSFDFLPLKSNGNIHEGNALRMDWNEVLPVEQCSYICGNPPFLGYTYQSPDQKADLASIWVDENGRPTKGSKKLDYVSCWYYKAAKYMWGTNLVSAFVSTNSICQGEQATNIWKPLRDLFDVHIEFAYPSFSWSSEASDEAHVHVVIVGFTCGSGDSPKKLCFSGSMCEVERINSYLSPSADVFVEGKTTPISDGVPAMSAGNRPADGGNLIIEACDYADFISADPDAVRYIRPFMGSREVINGLERWCLWLVGVDEAEIRRHPAVQARVEARRVDRLAAPDAGRRKLAGTPALFREQVEGTHPYLVVPQVSSENRAYIPIGYVSKETICSNLLFIVPDGGLYEFSILTSQMHNAWMRTVAGRLKSDYRYSQKLVYNTFPWPSPDELRKAEVEARGRAVLDVRERYQGMSLADLYKAEAMPADLLAAHKALDAAVEAAYGVDFNGDEGRMVAHLFALYSEITGEA